jgi:4-hydroxybenzoate polyprenyltransferase
MSMGNAVPERELSRSRAERPLTVFSLVRKRAWAFRRLLRPRQWVKNGLVFAALLFSGRLTDIASAELTILTFIGFCLASSAAYSLNDSVDAEKDRRHPKKRFRPVAMGLISPLQAKITAAILAAAALALGTVIDPTVGLLIALYLCLNVLYSLALKRYVLLDIMAIAAGYVLRAVAGAEAIHVELSLWFLVCVPLLSLFLAAAKRRHELVALDEAVSYRGVLTEYSTQLLDQILAALSAAIIITYFLYSKDSAKPHLLMATSPLVIYGVFRYLYLVYKRPEESSPDESMFSDVPLLVTVALWAVAAVVVLYIA